METGSGISYAQLRRGLRMVTWGYLALPVLLFIGGWCKPWVAVLAFGCFGVGVWCWWVRRKGEAVDAESGDDGKVKAVWWGLVLVTVVLATVISLNGVGGLGQQTWDWDKHLAILKDLMELDWPVAYDTGKETATLTYYVAYYLPAAMVGKVGGWEVANWALWGWTLGGAVLAVGWLTVLARASWGWALLVMLLFSGMDIIGYWLVAGVAQPWGWIENFDLEWWASYFTYPSNVTLLAYAPHQGVAGWLLTGLLVEGMRRDVATAPYVWIAVVSMLWSPFLTLGLMALAGVYLLLRREKLLECVRGGFRFSSLMALPVGVLLVLYFASRTSPVQLPHWMASSADEITRSSFVVLPAMERTAAYQWKHGCFLAVEFVVLAVLLGVMLGKLKLWDQWKGLLVSAVAVLLVIPCFRYGHFNDLAMRASIPALFMLQILVATVLVQSGREIWRSAAGVMLSVCLLVGALYPLNMMRLSVIYLGKLEWRLSNLPKLDEVEDIMMQRRRDKHGVFSAVQYFGSSRAYFFRKLARKLDAEHERVYVKPTRPQSHDDVSVPQ